MKTTASVSLEETLAEEAKRAATSDGMNFSTWTAMLIERELISRDAATARDWEHEQGRDTAAHFAALEAERAATDSAIRAENTAW